MSASHALYGLYVCLIYAVLGANLFADYHNESGIPYFGSFSMSFYMLLGIATGHHDWTGLMMTVGFLPGEQEGDGVPDAALVFFLISFTALVTIVAMNIIVAVLLEGFLSSMSMDEKGKRIKEEAREHHRCAGALDALLATLSNFSSPQHLKSQLHLLFDLWDVDGNGTIDYEEMRTGMMQLGYEPQIQLSSEDWDSFTHHGMFVCSSGEMSRERFELAMRFQLAEYAQVRAKSGASQSAPSTY